MIIIIIIIKKRVFWIKKFLDIKKKNTTFNEIVALNWVKNCVDPKDDYFVTIDSSLIYVVDIE